MIGFQIIQIHSFEKTLKKEFGPIEVWDYKNLGWENITWRIVRPGNVQDNSSLHVDQWFRDTVRNGAPPGNNHFQVWVPLFCEAGISGLRVISGSHTRQWKYRTEMIGSDIKPIFNEKVEEGSMKTHNLKPGQGVVFSSKLLHGGAIGKEKTTRISFEFSFFAPHSTLPSS